MRVQKCRDLVMLLSAVISGRAKWHQWEDGKRGEVSVGGMRYVAVLGDDGCPILHDHIRAALLKSQP